MYDIRSGQNRRRFRMDHIEAPAGFFDRSAEVLAPTLIGCILRREDERGSISGLIVETEAYTQDDPASHSFCGVTVRNRIMFEVAGLAYVYLIYGIHNCFNVTSGAPGKGEAVLIRAVEPLEGIEIMISNRGTDSLENLCSGPGKLCQAFGITREHNGVSLADGEIRILAPATLEKPDVIRTVRIGITKAAGKKRRFVLRGSRWVSGENPDGKKR
jgi:DNA-3-methyladenine glycosylase